jgi:hypothetical protein
MRSFIKPGLPFRVSNLLFEDVALGGKSLLGERIYCEFLFGLIGLIDGRLEDCTPSTCFCLSSYLLGVFSPYDDNSLLFVMASINVSTKIVIFETSIDFVF